jgi:hypothetical protein
MSTLERTAAARAERQHEIRMLRVVGLRWPHHRWFAVVDRVDDLGVVDAAQVDGGDAEGGVSELALDEVERDALAHHLDRETRDRRPDRQMILFLERNGHLARNHPLPGGNKRVSFTCRAAAPAAITAGTGGGR